MANSNETTDATEQSEETGEFGGRQAPSEFTAITSKGKKVQFVKGNMPDADWAKLWESSKRASAETGVTKKHISQAEAGGATVRGKYQSDKARAEGAVEKVAGLGAKLAADVAFNPAGPVAGVGQFVGEQLASPGYGAQAVQDTVAGVVGGAGLAAEAAGLPGLGKQLQGAVSPSDDLPVSTPPVSAEVPPPQDQTQAQPAVGTSAGVGMVEATPSFRGAVAAKADNTAINEAIQGVKANQKQLQAALDNEDKIRTANFEKQKQAQLDQEAAILETADRQRMALMRRQEEADKYAARADEIRQQARQAASDPIDPNRFWNNKNIGQKAAAVIAGALFGFTGQGMQWLQRLDSLVAEDMRAQESDRASKVSGLRDEYAGLGEAAKLALAKGASEAEAMNIDKMARLEGIKTRLEIMVQESQNAEVKTRGVQMIGETNKRLDHLAGISANLANHDADRQTQVSIANMKEAADFNAMMAKVSMQGAGGVEMDPETVRKIGRTREMVSDLSEMERLSADAGFWNRVGRMKDELLTSEERAKKARFEALSVRVKKNMVDSALQQHEIELMAPVIGERTKLFYSGTPQFQELRQMAIGAMKSQLEAAKYGKTGNLPMMQADIANLESQGAPLPQKERK